MKPFMPIPKARPWPLPVLGSSHSVPWIRSKGNIINAFILTN